MCECGQGANEEMNTPNAAIAAIKSDVDQLNSIDMTMIFRMV